MEDEIWQVFSEWLRHETFPSEHNFPGIKQAFESIFEASDADATAMLIDACQHFRLMAGDAKKLMHECQADNTRLVLENRELHEQIQKLTNTSGHTNAEAWL